MSRPFCRAAVVRYTADVISTSFAFPIVIKWFDRTLPNSAPAEPMPNGVERLRGRPARLHSRPEGVTVSQPTFAPEGQWSIPENAGHLSDLEPLWIGRVHDIINGCERLRDDDLENTKTNQADHNAKSIVSVLGLFEVQRAQLLQLVRGSHGVDGNASSLHPWLLTPNLVAEHDDHHLVRNTQILETSSQEVTLVTSP